MMANGILNVCGNNPIVIMAAICLVGTFITEFISNTATGAMFYPIVYNAAISMGYDPFPFCVALMISVSSSSAHLPTCSFTVLAAIVSPTLPR